VSIVRHARQPYIAKAAALIVYSTLYIDLSFAQYSSVEIKDSATDTNYTQQSVKAVSVLTATLTEFCLYGTNYPRMKLILRTPWLVLRPL